MKLLSIVLALPIVALCTPTSPPKCTPKSHDYVDNFENLPLNPIFPQVGAQAAGGLFYRAWGISSSYVIGAPPSPPNFIASGFRAELVDGEPQFLPINSTVVAFDLKSVDFACKVSAQAPTPVSVFVACAIQVAGVKYGTGETVIQELLFDPGLTGNVFNHTTFSSTFKGLTSASFALIQTSGDETLTAKALDNVAYRAYNTWCP